MKEGGEGAGQQIHLKSESSSHRSTLGTLSAMVQGMELLSVLSLFSAFSLVARLIAGSRTWTDIISNSCSSTVVILSSVVPFGDVSLVTVVILLLVGSGLSSAQQGDGRLGSVSGVELVRTSLGQTVNRDPLLASIYFIKVKSARGPSSDDGTLHAGFRLSVIE